ncbi:RNA-directed DNA polymerase, eukaryota, nucleotide-binding alpha-beta plait domain protein, partial [Tanacetum coccineum]
MRKKMWNQFNDDQGAGQQDEEEDEKSVSIYIVFSGFPFNSKFLMGTRKSKEDDWTEVTRKNRGYRTKEDDLVKVHSNADLTRTISKSIFVTNFPDNTTSADLWNICQTYGVVVDVYIPNRRSKVGKRFAFVRFIKVTNVERLVGNLCTLWIGRMHLHANVVRFERTPFQQSQPPVTFPYFQ